MQVLYEALDVRKYCMHGFICVLLSFGGNANPYLYTLFFIISEIIIGITPVLPDKVDTNFIHKENTTHMVLVTEYNPS